MVYPCIFIICVPVSSGPYLPLCLMDILWAAKTSLFCISKNLKVTKEYESPAPFPESGQALQCNLHSKASLRTRVKFWLAFFFLPSPVHFTSSLVSSESSSWISHQCTNPHLSDWWRTRNKASPQVVFPFLSPHWHWRYSVCSVTSNSCRSHGSPRSTPL